MRMLACALLAVTLLVSGCGWVKEKVGIGGPTQEQIDQNNRKLQDGDALVQKWAEKLQPTAEGDFVRHEGLTEVDPWGNHLRVSYSRSFFTQTLTVRSAGPDGQFDTKDDLLRQRERRDVLGFFTGSWAFIGLWVGLGLLALVIANARRRRAEKKAASTSGGSTAPAKKKRRGVISTVLLILLGGLAFAAIGIAALTEALLGIVTPDCDSDSDSDCPGNCGDCDSDSPGNCGDCDCDCNAGGCDCDSDCG